MLIPVRGGGRFLSSYRVKAGLQPQLFRNYRAAFTLAEVLITIGIIGVVAALTLPSLIEEHKNKEIVTALKRHYSVMGNAYQLAINESAPDTWSYSVDKEQVSRDFADEISKYLNVAKRFDNYTEKNMYGLTGEKVTNPTFPTVLVLNDSSKIYFGGSYFSSSCTGNARLLTVADECMWVAVDVNGDKKPNKLGDDIFYFVMTKTSYVPGGDGYWEINKCRPYKVDGHDIGHSLGCTKYVLIKENRDYFKCKTGSENICKDLKL
ncbi:MAG: type II secretion system protein [Candidatus Gastranaerophilaceae bacterium]